MSAATTRLAVPATAKRGEIIEIRTLVAHPMETGFRRGQRGEPVPRDIITMFTCRYNGIEVFRARLSPAISANPYLAFSTRAIESGTIECTWSGDNGFTARDSARITVT